MSSPVSWLVEVGVKPGQPESFTELMHEMVASTRDEPGAWAYEWFVGVGDIVHMYERYADSDAMLAHLAGFGGVSPGGSCRWSTSGDFT